MNRTTMLALATGLVIGLAVGRLIASAQAQSPSTSVQTRDGVIVFVIDGHDAARIDATGLYVRGDIAYGGTMTDYGAVGFDEHVKSRGARHEK